MQETIFLGDYICWHFNNIPDRFLKWSVQLVPGIRRNKDEGAAEVVLLREGYTMGFSFFFSFLHCPFKGLIDLPV